MEKTKARRGRLTRARRCGVVLAAVLLLLGITPTALAGAGRPHGSGDADVVRDWNAIAWRTIAVDGAVPPAPANPPQVAQLYLAFVSVAVYNAVVTVEGGGKPTLPQRRAHSRASSDAAAATAAYHVLRHFFPDSAQALRTDYRASLADVRPGSGRDQGIRVGRKAAAALIASREGDGRNAVIRLPDRTRAKPGDWVPTTPGVEFGAPWLGFTRPVLIRSPRHIKVDGPDRLTSAAYAADFAEVASMGAATGSDRSPRQTATALFWSDNPPRQYQDAMRDRSERRDMGIVSTARMFAAANAAGADALITCWRVKYKENFWRPVTAIHQAGADGNPATAPDPGWASLLAAPPYPEYPSGHACVSSGVARALENLFGARRLDMRIANAATGDVRRYSTERAWLGEVVNARIWLGIHFRDAMDDGRSIGHRVADHVVDRWFSRR
jgi:hypothetical protein